MSEFNYKAFTLWFEGYLQSQGLSGSFAHFVNTLSVCVFIAIIAIAANYITRIIIIQIIKRWVDRSSNIYDDTIYEKGVFNKLSHIAPAIIIFYLAPLPLFEYESFLKFILTSVNIYMLIMILMVILSLVDALHEVYSNSPTGKQRSIKGYVQAAKTIIYFVGALMVISILVDKDLSSLFAGLTAFAAVLMFVFKDTILGLVAGIQLSSNDILRVGDYIEMPSKNADGTVIDIKLNTVKIHNTNRTICTIPTYAFVSESFWNWRGLEMSNGRRIKRSFLVDVSSIRFINESELIKYKSIDILKTYFEQKEGVLSTGDKAIFDGKAFTNISLYRAYIEAYLRKHPLILLDNYFAVRHLQPTDSGLPIEIYIYITEKAGPKFEVIQADIFDHILAIANEFDIRLFQRPTSQDFKKE